MKWSLFKDADPVSPTRDSSDIPPHAPAGQPIPLTKEGSGPGAGRRLLPEDRTRCLNWILRLLVGGAFVFAGGLKLADPAKFAQDVNNYRLVPHDLINLVAIILPWIEVVAGLFVLAGIWLQAAALVISSLTVMFFFVIVSALARGLNIECGCFGTVGGQHVGLVNLAIDATLFSLAAFLARRARDCPANLLFSEAGTQVSAPPLKASPKAS